LGLSGDPPADAEERRSACRTVCRSPTRLVNAPGTRSLSRGSAYSEGSGGDSDPYWSQTDWDPDARVYVVAGAGSGRYGFNMTEGAVIARSAAGRPRAAGAEGVRAGLAGAGSVAAGSERSSSGNCLGLVAAAQSFPEEKIFGRQCSGAACPKDRASSLEGVPRVSAANHVVCPASSKGSGDDAMVCSSSFPAVGEQDDVDFNYWNADAWDPDARIYVGAQEGFAHHLTASEEPSPWKALPAQLAG